MTKRVLCFLIAVLGLLAAGAALAADKFDLPADLQKLLPAEPALLIAVPSINATADDFTALTSSLDPDETVTREQVLAVIEENLPRFTEFVDLDRPAALAAGLPNLMGGGEPPMTWILPLRKDFPPLDDIAPNAVVSGDYVAVSTYPDYVPATTVPALANHLTTGSISASLDIAKVVLDFRPFIEMGLAGIPVRPADAPADSAAGFTAEEAAAMAQMIRSLLDSATRLDLALGRDGDLVALHTGLGVVPGSALDAGPQPDFRTALALTAALPADADIRQVIALDQRRIFDNFRDYYLISMRNAMGSLDAEHGARYTAWVEQYLASMDLWANPMAAAVRTSEAGMAAHVVMACDDPQDAATRLGAILDGMNGLGIGYALSPLPEVKVGGVEFRTWHVEINLEEFEAAMPGATGPAVSGTARMQAEQMVAILQKVLPTVYLGAGKDHLFLASAADTKALEAMVKAAGRKGTPHAASAAVAATAGRGCQQVLSGDLMTIVQWISEMTITPDATERVVLADNPIPFQADVTVDGADLGFDARMDLAALGRLAAAMDALDDEEDAAPATGGAVEGEGH